MEHKHIIISGLILILIVVGMFVFTYIKQQEIIESEANLVPIAEESKDTPYDYIDRVDAKHFFIDGTHTLVGEMTMPTPCDLLEWNTTIMESFPEQVIVDFKVINRSESCIQVMTSQRFQVSFDASRDASIRARLEGREIELNLIPAAKGESPDEFELFIKG